MKTHNLRSFRCPNNHLFIFALVSLIVFLFVEVVIRSYNLYYHYPIVDVPSHFFAGIAIGAGSFWIISTTKLRSRNLITILITFSVAILWEVLETLEELVIENPVYLRDIFFWDGFFDIIYTIIGGGTAIILIYALRKYTSVFSACT